MKYKNYHRGFEQEKLLKKQLKTPRLIMLIQGNSWKHF